MSEEQEWVNTVNELLKGLTDKVVDINRRLKVLEEKDK